MKPIMGSIPTWCYEHLLYIIGGVIAAVLFCILYLRKQEVSLLHRYNVAEARTCAITRGMLWFVVILLVMTMLLAAGCTHIVYPGRYDYGSR